MRADVVTAVAEPKAGAIAVAACEEVRAAAVPGAGPPSAATGAAIDAAGDAVLHRVADEVATGRLARSTVDAAGAAVLGLSLIHI